MHRVSEQILQRVGQFVRRERVAYDRLVAEHQFLLHRLRQLRVTLAGRRCSGRGPVEARTDVVRRRTNGFEAVEAHVGRGGDPREFGCDFEQLMGSFGRMRHRQMCDPVRERGGIGFAYAQAREGAVGDNQAQRVIAHEVGGGAGDRSIEDGRRFYRTAFTSCPRSFHVERDDRLRVAPRNFAHESWHQITRQPGAQRVDQRNARCLRYVEVVRADHRIEQMQVIRQHVIVEQPLRQFVECVTSSLTPASNTL